MPNKTYFPVTVGVRLPLRTRKALDAWAADEEMSVSDLMRRILKEALVAKGLLPKPETPSVA